MQRFLTEKQTYMLRIIVTTAVIYLAFRYLLPLLLPFVAAFFLALLIRPAVRFLHKMFYIPMGIGAGVVLVVVLAIVIAAGYSVGRMVTAQLIQLGRQLPRVWEDFSRWLWTCCGQMEETLQLQEGTITLRIDQWLGGLVSQGHPGEGGTEAGSLWGIIETSLQGATGFLRLLISILVTFFVTIGATLITSSQLESLRRSMDLSPFGQEIRQICDILARVGVAYGKTQLVIMGCTVVISGVGLTILGDLYALLWALVIGLVDALPLFGAGTILWPWVILSLFRRQWIRAAGLAVIYVVSNLTRQWLEARYMGDRIGITPLANLIAMYVGLQLFGILGLFLGPIGYLLVKESVGAWTKVDKV